MRSYTVKHRTVPFYKYRIIFLLLLLLGLFSTCEDIQELQKVKNKIGLESYKLELVDVVIVEECKREIYPPEIKPCIYVNFELSNTGDKKIEFDIRDVVVVTKEGKQIKAYSAPFKYEKCLENREFYFELYPNARKNISSCLPLVNKTNSPIIYLELFVDGKRHEHKFNLTNYLETAHKIPKIPESAVRVKDLIRNPKKYHNKDIVLVGMFGGMSENILYLVDHQENKYKIKVLLPSSEKIELSHGLLKVYGKVVEVKTMTSEGERSEVIVGARYIEEIES